MSLAPDLALVSGTQKPAQHCSLQVSLVPPLIGKSIKEGGAVLCCKISFFVLMGKLRRTAGKCPEPAPVVYVHRATPS